MGLVWREQLSVGNGVIDADHKHLIGIINRVEHCLASKDRREIKAALDDLSQYAVVHFDREEKIAAAAGYTQVPHLSDSHRALLQNLEQVRDEIDAMGANWSAEAIAHFTSLSHPARIPTAGAQSPLPSRSLLKFFSALARPAI